MAFVLFVCVESNSGCCALEKRSCAWSELLSGVFESGVLDPRPKLLGFCMSGLVAHLYTSNKETWWSWTSVAHTYNPSYSGGRDQKD
jgi:hypothetical protein